jgi:putative membrane protein
MDPSDLPHLNAFLNSLSAAFLLTGYSRIRKNDRKWHRIFMIAAVSSSILFLASYLIYHAQAGSVRFSGRGWIRPVYFAILISHTILAAAIVPMVVLTLRHAWTSRFERHRRIARWTFPLWVYVSVTGVAVYLMLYH